MNRDVRLHSNAYEVCSVSKAVVLGADPSPSAAGKIEVQRLTGTASSRLTNDQSSFGLFESDGHVFTGGKGTRADEHDHLATEVP